MKHLYLTALALLTLVTIANPAQAVSRQPSAYTAPIKFFGFDKNSELAHYRIQDGYVNITNEKISISLMEHFHCPPKAFCAAMAPRLFKFEAPLVKVGQSCGSIYYQAVLDQTPVDGIRTVIQVADHTRRTCKDLVRFMTEIHLEVSGFNRIIGQPFTFKHYFGADALQPSFPVYSGR